MAAIEANNPLLKDAYYELGNFYQQANNYSLAIEYYQKAIATDNNFEAVYLALADLVKDSNEAIQYYNEVIQQNLMIITSLLI